MDIIISIHDRNLLGRVYPEDKSSYKAVFTMLKTIYGLRVSKEELAVAKQCIGGREPPKKQVREAYIISWQKRF